MRLTFMSCSAVISAKKLFYMAVMVCFLVATANLCFAQHGNDEIVWKKTDWFKVMNFGVLAVALFLVARKPVANALNGRIHGIKEELRVLEEKKEEAQKQLTEYNKRLAALEQETEAIIGEYRQQGEAAKARILASAEEAALKIEEQAKRNIANEFEIARQKLRQDIFDKAVARAEALVKERITAEDQNRLVEEYLDKAVLQ